ncbi:MAG TPA: DUF72 domain-containing protein [Blastocatellia bacterium]|jgi:Uncharacterized conserved protein
MNARACRIGCAGWNLPKYLRDPSLSYLERYAQLFNCVEINSSFYRHHQPKTYARWADAVPEDFRFSVKAPRAITHTSEAVKAAIDRFLNEIRELGEKLGPLLIQFPPKAAFKRSVASELFLSFREKFNGEIVCEPRHATWFELEAYELLKAYSISLVVADPKPVSSAPEVLEQESRYYRLHGAPRIYYSEYTVEFLRQFKRNEALNRVGTWVIFDNTAHGYAYQNALTLMESFT